MDVIRIAPLSVFARKLEEEGFVNEGPYTGDALLGEFEAGGECVPADDRQGLKRFRRLALRRWAKWFFTDEAGNPVLICVGRLDQG